MLLPCRVAFETLQEHRDDIAYKVRFDSSAGAGTRVTFLTEGVLLRMLVAAPLLPQYDVIIIDEVLPSIAVSFVAAVPSVAKWFER